MFKIVLFQEESSDAWSTPLKMGSLYLNVLTIDEAVAIEVIGIYNLVTSFSKMSFPYQDEFKNFQRERVEKERDDLEIFRAGIEQLAKDKLYDLTPFFIYAGNYYRWNDRMILLHSILRQGSLRLKPMYRVYFLDRLVITKLLSFSVHGSFLKNRNGEPKNCFSASDNA